jgi:tetratricopeptide (TPR) repeat protein
LTTDVVKKAAAHEDVSVVLIPAIKRMNGSYKLTAEIRNIISQNAVEVEPVQTSDKDSILYAMDKLAKIIRMKLGEPSSRISDNYTPIVKATTSSLKALKLFAEGMNIKLTDESIGYNLIEQAITIDPEFALAHAELGKHYYINGNRKKGEEHFQKALNQMNRLTLRERLWIRALVAESRGEQEKAIDHYKTYLNQYPDDYNAWWRLGYAYLSTGNDDECIEAFNRYVEYEPLSSGALVNIATCYNSKGENKQALKYYRKAFKVYPEIKKHRFINNEYGFLLVEMDSLEKARETFELMLTDSDTEARGYRSLALLNTYQGNFSKGIDYFKKAILLNESQNFSLSEYRNRIFLAKSYLMKGMKNEFKDEIKEIERLVDEMNLSPSWLSKAGHLFVKNNMTDKAQWVMRKIKDSVGDTLATSAVNRDISMDEAFYHLINGEVALATGKEEEAIESLKIADNVLDFPNSLAHYYYKTGDLDKAINFYDNVINEKSLGNEDQLRLILAHYNLGKIYQEQGKVNRAIKYYEQFIDIWKKGDEDLWALQNARKQLEKLDEVTSS